MTTTARLVAVLAIGSFLFAGGCASVQTPTAAVQTVALGDVNLQGLTLNLGVNVNNPNNFALPAGTADYKLGVAGVTLVNDSAKAQGTIPAKGSQVVTVPVHLTFEDLLKAKDAIAQGRGEIPYDLDSGLTFDTGPAALLGQNARVPVHYSGTLNIQQILQDNWRTVASSPAAQKLAAEAISGLTHLFGK
jgi:LEA14-like dessication related protein